MSSTNIYRRLLELLPSEPTLTATVAAVHADGTATVTYPGGGTARLRNPFDQTAGQPVYTQGDAITGAAPDLPLVLIEIGT